MNIKEIYNYYKEHFLVDTDTRTIRKNTMFFALKGENFNGNKFAEEAIKLGAKYAIVDDKKYKTKPNIILVKSVLETLQQLANYHRNQLNIPVIALTGSNGKTTTKELINIVLSKKYKTTATKGNLNNHIGVPLTLLSIKPETEIAIIEMGANHQKEIEFLSNICEPDFGYITNFGKAHLEGFGGVEGVIKGKSELYTYIKNNQKNVFVNPNDAIQKEKTANCNRIFFENTLEHISSNPFVKLKYRSLEIQSNLIGAYNYANITAAITIGNYFKVSNNDIKNAIEYYTPQNNRSQIIKTKKHQVILDAYNANPTSMKAALENFSSLISASKIAILGDMFELGESSKEEHIAISNLAEKLNIDKTFLVGKHFYEVDTKNIKFKNFKDLESFIKNNPLEAQSILIKGSRGMQLERVLKLLS